MQRSIHGQLARFIPLISLSLINCSGNSPWEPIGDCIIGIQTDYESDDQVSTDAQAAAVFSEFLTHSAANGIDVFDLPATTWSDPVAKPHGTYQGVRYWLISARRDGVTKTVFDISEDGHVVRMLGCI